MEPTTRSVADHTTPAGTAPLPSSTLDVMRQVLEQHFGLDASALTLDRRIDTLGLDSLSFVEYAFEIEKQLSIVLPDLPRDLGTVGDLARIVQLQVDARANADTEAR